MARILIFGTHVERRVLKKEELTARMQVGKSRQVCSYERLCLLISGWIWGLCWSTLMGRLKNQMKKYQAMFICEEVRLEG